ncbi:MAG: hypothetical protein ACREHD_28640 [Pirellulales bacterium]
MTVQGHVRNGVIVLDTATALPEGAAVTVHVITPQPETKRSGEDRPIMKHAGVIKGLGRDASRRIDEVLYGDLTS